jgi:hypothetical protein
MRLKEVYHIEKEEVLNRVLLLANAIAVAVSLYVVIPQVHKLAREYSAWVSLLCAMSGDRDCARWAGWIADQLWATRTDEAKGFVKIINSQVNKENKTPKR